MTKIFLKRKKKRKKDMQLCHLFFHTNEIAVLDSTLCGQNS